MARAYLAFKVRSELEIASWREKTPAERLAYGCSLADMAAAVNPIGFARMVEHRWKHPNASS